MPSGVLRFMVEVHVQDTTSDVVPETLEICEQLEFGITGTHSDAELLEEFGVTSVKVTFLGVEEKK